MAEYSIPKRASLEDIQDILKAYYIEGAHREPVSTGQVESTADMGSSKVGRQTSFLDEIGVIEKVGSERKMTEDGESIAEALMGGNSSLAKSLLREVVKNWEFTEKIESFVRMQEPDPVEDGRLLEFLKANASSNDKRGRSTLLDTLVWVDILDESEQGYTLSDKGGSDIQPQIDDDESPSSGLDSTPNNLPSIGQDKKEVETGRMDDASTSNLQINIEFSGSEDPEEAEELVKAIRRGLEQELENSED